MAIDYTTIEEVINDFQLMIDDTSYDKEAQIYQLRLLALQGLRELTFDVEQKVKTSTHFVDTSSVATTLPNDFARLLRVGFKGSDGDFHALGHNPDLSLDFGITAQAGGGSYDENNPYYHTDLGKKFGVGGGNNNLGYYRLNKNDNTINFSSGLAGKTVYMEYISDGITATPGKDHVVRFKMATSASLSSSRFGVIDGSTILIPSGTSTGASTYTFNDTSTTAFEDLTENPTSKSIYLPLIGENAATSAEIAEALTNTINEGHPRYHVDPFSSNTTASNINDEVTIVVSNFGVPPVDLLHTTDTFESNLYNILTPANYSVEEQNLIQLGSAGDVPKIHKFSEEALRSYIYYKYIQRKRGVPANEKQMAKRAYFNEKRLARARMMNFSKETAMQTSRKAFKQSPKM